MSDYEQLPFFNDFDISEKPIEELSPKLLSVEIFQQAIAQHLSVDDPLRDYAEWVLPHLVEEFTLVAAKGGEFVEKQRADGKSEKTLARYERDQSLLAHILNGLLPVARIARYLKDRQAPQFRRFNDMAYRLFCIGYTLHDIDKVLAVKARMAGEKLTLAVNKPRFLALLSEQIERLGLHVFFNQSDSTAYKTHLVDIAYIVANTQERWGTYRQTFDLDITLDFRVLGMLCDLSQLCDHIAYLAPSPRDTASNQKQYELLERLSNGTVQFVCHSLAENRGVLTNIINSAAISQMIRDPQNPSCLPLLFAPNGVVYLAPISYVPPTVEQIADAAVEKIKTICKKQVEDTLVGFGVDRLKRNIKEAEFYQLLFTPEERLSLGLRYVESRGKQQTFTTILNKLPEGATFPVSTGRRESDQFAKFCHFITRILREGNAVNIDIAYDDQVLDILRLNDDTFRSEFTAFNRLDSNGGSIYRWYRAAAVYLDQNPGLSADDGTFQKSLRKHLPAFNTLFHPDDRTDKWVHVQRYFYDVVSVGLRLRERSDDKKSRLVFDEWGVTQAPMHDFEAELRQYETAKAIGSTGVCSLCMLPYDVKEQGETGILFAPQVYTGRELLGGGALKRSICAICRLEQMLRMILLRGVDVQGGEFENKRKVRYLYIYPSYFFSTETLTYVRRMITNLQGFKFTEVKRQLIPERTSQVKWAIDGYQRLQSLLINPRAALPNMEGKSDSLDGSSEEDSEGEDTSESRTDSQNQGNNIIPAYPPSEPMTFLFFGISHKETSQRKITDTETWVIPTFLGLVLPIVLDAKIVVSASSVPLFLSGADFPETVVLDAPHPFVQNILAPSRAGKTSKRFMTYPRVHIDDVLPALQTLTVAYAIHLDAHASTSTKDYYRWGELTKVSQDLATDPLYAFLYFERAVHLLESNYDNFRKTIQYKQKAQLYIQLVTNFVQGGKEAMSIPRDLTLRYRAFYRSKTYKSNGILKPISQSAETLLSADKRLLDDDGLFEAITGSLRELMERIHKNTAEGRPNPELWIERNGKRVFDYQAEEQAIREFARYLVYDVFVGVLRHDRAALAGRQLNLIKNACQTVYMECEALQATPGTTDNDDDLSSDNPE